MDKSLSRTLAEPAMVAPRLTALREAIGMSKTDFARLLDIDKSTWTKIENGQMGLKAEKAAKIFQLYGVDMNYIYLGQVHSLPSHLSSEIVAHLSGANE